VCRRRTCELNVVLLQTVRGLLIPMEHPHAADCRYVIAFQDLFWATLLRLVMIYVDVSLMERYSLVLMNH